MDFNLSKETEMAICGMATLFRTVFISFAL